MSVNQIKLIAIALVTVPLVVLTFIASEPFRFATKAGEDVAPIFKAKCAACHSPKAVKFFDPTKADDVLVQAILKGKKGEKPPYMPEWESKGITGEQAQLLVTYMKGLRAADSASNSNANANSQP
jgi:mono/diheme cytochrome c family protein